ncbi:hypothetical protein PAAG_01731 [Paracoccidioides lutzii Pb01]|uniref:Large ribosomal subunit protein mL54 n=1 Tax=Paracoccidioides lutzii (strain ATCC MYA-826 / Pb01) TaxID=502779 RepID=C1GT86_PARBA|nr:hypothetical protein PAAG_01731 [Paracoccidioides lutzii Pb01]EEH39269.1 hypothetical protein PAAG_01731 [Paracoccidioides lutzii Pb01]
MFYRRCRTSLLPRLPFQLPNPESVQASRCTVFLPYKNQTLRAYSTSITDVSTPFPSSSAPSITLPGAAHPPPASPESKKDAPPRVISGTPAGTKLKGLNYMKNQPEVFALEDDEYPDWLWSLLDDAKAKSNTDGGVDTSTMNKKKLRHEKRMADSTASEPRNIPLHEQAVDITPADAVAQSPGSLELASSSAETRAQITKSARAARRKAIKEANYLQGM